MYFKGVYCIINVLFRLPRDGGRAVLVSEIVLWVALSVFTLKITSSNSLIPLSSLIKTAFFFYLILTKQIFTVLMIYLFFIYRCCGGLVVSQRGDTGPAGAFLCGVCTFSIRVLWLPPTAQRPPIHGCRRRMVSCLYVLALQCTGHLYPVFSPYHSSNRLPPPTHVRWPYMTIYYLAVKACSSLYSKQAVNPLHLIQFRVD